MEVTIHCEPRVPWQGPFARKMSDGLKRIGIPHEVTNDRDRLNSGLSVLLGTTFWRSVEATGPYLLVDRCSYGDTNRWVSLVRDGHGRRGDHRVPERVTAERWERHGFHLQAWKSGARTVLCGQTDTYSPHYPTVEDWYGRVPEATHFRPHPAGTNPTGLPLASNFLNCRVAVTLNSSVAVQAVMQGIPTVTMDEGSMAWDVTGHKPSRVITPDRELWCHWLAHTQFSHDEIAEGLPIAHLLE